MVLILVGLLGVNVYFLGMRGGTSIGALLRTAHIHEPATPTPSVPVAKTLPKTAPVVEDPAGGHVVEGVLADGQTVAQALAPLVGKKLASSVETALGERFDLAAVRAGQPYALVYDADDRVVAFELRVSPVLAHRVDLGRKLIGSSLEGKADTRVVELVLPAGPSLWDALHRAGESVTLGERLALLFGGDGDVTGLGAQPGERVRVVVEKRLRAGRFVRYGRILGAEWVARAGSRRAFAFGTSAYTERGESAAHDYLLSPIRASHATAKVARVEHVEGGPRPRLDFAAPPNTVVVAVAAGTVTSISRAGATSTITVEVAPSERVTYARVTHVARGLQIGGRVAQAQALGRVDAGVSLAFDDAAGALHDGHSPSPRSATLSTSDRPRFGETIAPILERLSAMPLRLADPLAGRALSAIP